MVRFLPFRRQEPGIQAEAMIRREGRIVHTSRDQWGEIVVTDTPLNRYLYFDSHYKQSGMSLLHPAILVLRYTTLMAAGLIFRPPRSVLLIGLGGGALARFLRHYFPDCRIDAVELRERVVEVAHAYFRVPENDPLLRCHVADGRDFLFNAPQAFSDYDLVFLDAFDDHGPSPTVTVSDIYQAVAERLAPGGVMCANLWNRRCDDFKGHWASARKAFGDRTLKYQIDRHNSNVVLLGFTGPIPDLGAAAPRRVAADLSARVGLDLEDTLRGLRRQNASRLRQLLGLPA